MQVYNVSSPGGKFGGSQVQGQPRQLHVTVFQNVKEEEGPGMWLSVRALVLRMQGPVSEPWYRKEGR